MDVAAIDGLTANSQTFTWSINPKVSVTAIDDQTTEEGKLCPCKSKLVKRG